MSPLEPQELRRARQYVATRRHPAETWHDAVQRVLAELVLAEHRRRVQAHDEAGHGPWDGSERAGL